MRQIILDTETTGLYPAEGHRIVEIGGVEMLNRRLTGRNIHFYLNPDRESDPEALRVHGLDSDFLADKPRFQEVSGQLIEFVQDAEIIIHNAPFDIGFLDAELDRIGQPAFGSYIGNVIDSLLYARELHPGKRCSLDALCDRYGISNAHRTLHGALLDSELLAEVWLAMTRGQDGLLMDFDGAEHSGGLAGGGQDDFDVSVLKVLRASADELAAHEAVLDAIEAQSKKTTLWRTNG